MSEEFIHAFLSLMVQAAVATRCGVSRIVSCPHAVSHEPADAVTFMSTTDMQLLYHDR